MGWCATTRRAVWRCRPLGNTKPNTDPLVHLAFSTKRRRRQHSISFRWTPLLSFFKLIKLRTCSRSRRWHDRGGSLHFVTESINTPTASLSTASLLPFPVLDTKIYSPPPIHYELRGIGGGEQGGGHQEDVRHNGNNINNPLQCEDKRKTERKIQKKTPSKLIWRWHGAVSFTKMVFSFFCPDALWSLAPDKGNQTLRPCAQRRMAHCHPGLNKSSRVYHPASVITTLKHLVIKALNTFVFERRTHRHSHAHTHITWWPPPRKKSLDRRKIITLFSSEPKTCFDSFSTPWKW